MPADPVAVDAGLMAEAEGLLVKYDIDMRHEKADEIRADFYAALQAAEERGAERMRDRAAAQAESHRLGEEITRMMLDARTREVKLWAVCSSTIAAAIRALPLSETEK